MPLNEFEVIQQFFTDKSTHRDDVMLGVGDDCAIITAPANQSIAITTDTLVAGVHFPITTSAYDIGFKSLAVNLSDLAAMGAAPAWITLALTLPEADEKWLNEFCRGLFALTARYHVQLIGGDLAQGPLSITITAHGLLAKNQALRRDAAKVGDLIYVTHTLGDAAAGLQILQNKITVKPELHEHFMARLNRPEPRVEMGESLLGVAHAAIDISDGLAVDLGHILERSCLGAEIFPEKIPLSNELRHAVSAEKAIAYALNGGDDYELCVTVPENKKYLMGAHYTCIGTITEKPGLRLLRLDGNPYNVDVSGYSHF